MMTPELSATTIQQQAVFAKYGITKARYFANVANMDIQGVDVKLNNSNNLSSSSKIDFGVWFHYNENKLNDSVSTQECTTKTMLEDGQPKASLRFLTNYKYKKINTALNITRYGAYKQAIDGMSYKFDPEWTTDLDISYNISKSFKASIGGINIFDAIPNKWDGLDGDYYGANGIKPYSRYSPFGYSGAYYYLRLSAKF